MCFDSKNDSSCLVASVVDLLLLPIFVMTVYEVLVRVRTGLNSIQGSLLKSLKNKSAVKNTGKTLKAFQKTLNFTIYCRI